MYYTVKMGDRNYSGIADRFDHKTEWTNLAKINNYAPIKIGTRVRIPDSWIKNSHPAMFRQRRIAQPMQRGVFGVGATTNVNERVPQDQCMTALDALKTVENPYYTNLVSKYGQDSADKRWAMISKASCYDKEYMIQVPWVKLAGAVGVGVLLGVGATYAGMKMMG